MINSLDEIIKKISDERIKVISFDIFDTLLCRPVLREKDVFELLDRDFSRCNSSSTNFAQIRTEAEAVLRRQIIKGTLKKEDITLTEIYDVIAKEFYVEEPLAKHLMEKEIELELKLCIPRHSGKMLFEAALNSGKRIVLVSDMYLEKKYVTKLLIKNGFEGYETLYLSSDCGLRKITGNIYRHLIDILAVAPEDILHIGDSKEADYNIPSSLGISAVHFPSSRDVFNAYGCATQVQKICSDLTDWEKAQNSVGIGIMRQMAANFYFDNPYREFEESSDYNSDALFVGYASLGPELLALNKWIVENIKRDNPSKIIFLSRDGYMPKKIYDLYREYHPELPESQYLYVSRRTVLPAMIRTATDLYNLPVDVTYQTPAKLIKLLDFCTRDGYEVGGESNTCFTKETYQKFIATYINEGYDEERHRKQIQKIGDYLLNNPVAPLTADAVLFDMGYSGRIASAISYASGLSNTSYYFHADSNSHFSSCKKSGTRIRTFFDFNPYMESSLREYSYLEVAPSPIAYKDNYEVEFDIGPAEGYGVSATKMQEGAIQFAKEYFDLFNEYEDETQFRPHDAAMIFESFIRYCSEYDKKIYESVLIDDELWGGRRDINLKKLMNARLSKLPQYAKRNDLC